MTRSLLLVAALLLAVSPHMLAVDPGKASGTMVIGKHKVAIKHVYLVSASEGFSKGRRLIFSSKDIGASIGKCGTISCASGDLDEGFELDLDSGDRLNLWAVANGQKVQHSDTAERSGLKATVNKADAVTGVLAIDRSATGGPKVNVEFNATLLKAFKK